jgi:predicted acetyltransferase
MGIDVTRAAREWHLRVPAPDEMRAFMAPLREAFGEESSDPEIDDWLKVCEPNRWLGAFEDAASDLVVGVASAYTVRLTVPGGEVGAAAVTGVATRPDYHRRGILRALMRRQIDDVRDQGEPVAVLWASEGAIYQRFGYGMAARDGFIEVATVRTAYTRQLPPEGRVRLVGEDEALAIIPAVYDAMRSVTPGAISRTPPWWQTGPIGDPEYSRRGASHKYRVVYEADGQAEGYAVYRIKDDWDHRGPKSVLEVKEAVTTTPRALRELWRYLFEVDLVRTVKALRAPVPNPLQHILLEPRALGLVVNDGLWVRLVDLPAALAGRRYGRADSLVLEVSDAFCPWNAGAWRIETAGEPWEAVARVERTEDQPDLVLDTTDLAAIYLGGIRPTLLAVARRIHERTPGALRRSDVLFAADRTPWCVSMF